MKITTNNSLTKLLELLKEKVIQLQNYIAQKPNIDDNTPRSSAVYSSQKVQAIVDTNTVAIQAKPSISDDTPSTTAVYSSSKVEELLSGVSGGAIYKEISILFVTEWIAEDDHFKYTHLLTTEDWTNKVCFVDGIYGNNPQTGEVSYREYISRIYKGQLVHDENGTSLVLYSYDRMADLHLKVTLFDKANDIQTLAPPSNETVLESNSVYINNSNNIDDISDSDYTTYSSNKIEELLGNIGENYSYVTKFIEFEGSDSPLKLTPTLDVGAGNEIQSYAPFSATIDIPQMGLVGWVNENTKAVIHAHYRNKNPRALKYVTCNSDGTITCRFSEDIGEYTIQAIELSPITKTTVNLGISFPPDLNQ